MANHERIEPIADIPKILETIVRMLQADPQRYRWFGCWWWAVKRILKQHGYGPDQVYFLGPSTDPEAERHLPAETDDYLLAQAIREHHDRSFYERDHGDAYYPDTGEPYHLDDPDFGGMHL